MLRGIYNAIYGEVNVSVSGGTRRLQNVEYFVIVSDLTFIVIMAPVGCLLCFVFMTCTAHDRFLLKSDSV